jgi:hypothetical protein
VIANWIHPVRMGDLLVTLATALRFGAWGRRTQEGLGSGSSGPGTGLGTAPPYLRSRLA